MAGTAVGIQEPAGFQIPEDVPDKKKFFTIAELVDMGYGSRTTVWRDMQDHGLPNIQIGRRVLIPREDFVFWCRDHRRDLKRG